MILLNLITPEIKARVRRPGQITPTCEHTRGGVICDACRRERVRAQDRAKGKAIRQDPERHARRKKNASTWAKKTYDADPEKGAAITRAWRQANPEKSKEIDRRWRERNPEKSAANTRAWQRNNKERWADTRKAWASRNPERVRLNSRKYSGIVDAHLCDAVLALQGGVCAICQGSNPGSGRSGRTWQADHDHAPGGLLRGMLCRGCNVGLGHFKDSPDTLRRAISYLENPPANDVRAREKKQA